MSSVDLGSGVGNCVTQVALQAGSRSYGFELLPVPAHCARLQMQETKRRWAMWCLNGNTDTEAHEGDFRTIPDVAKRLTDADVVVSHPSVTLRWPMSVLTDVKLVNNEVFPSSLNIDLTNMFLDLKDGAKIVSLKPFVPEGFRMNESNVRHLTRGKKETGRNETKLTPSVTPLPLLSSLLLITMLKDGSAGRAIRGDITSRLLIGVLGSSTRRE
jgi:hypothetical protein